MSTDSGVGAAADRRGAPLGEHELRVLEFEAVYSSNASRKAAEIRTRFGWTPARYYRILGELIDTPEAVRHDPMLVARLQRLRAARAAERAARTHSTGSSLDRARPRT